ncbi:MAG: bifunctional heptose 7-phosphate kinase/heptose 1-phosphate adenyltransferase [Elainellaceae cyanobacterium]
MTPELDFKVKLVHSADRLFDLINSFHQARILVAGDITLDEFVTGSVERLSREAPVLILRHESTRQIPGGGANAVYNIAKLGGQVKVVGLVGDDAQGLAIRRIFTEAGIDTAGLLLDRDRPTVTKSRISGHARQSVTQQIVRVDRKSDDPPAPNLQQALADYAEAQQGTVDTAVCSDYGDGVLSAPVIQAMLGFSRVVVDAQSDLHRYPGATVFTPNLPEAEKAVGYGITTPELLQRAGEDLLALTKAEKMLITRGEEGMSLFEGGSQLHIPAFNRTDVFDVTGAGDTVVAGLSLSLSVGASPWEAIVLGNLAASLVVRQFGTATTSAAEMKAALAALLDKFR